MRTLSEGSNSFFSHCWLVLLPPPGVYILIGAGSLVMLSQCSWVHFSACLLIIFGSEVAAGVFGFLNRQGIVEDVQNFYAKTYDENNNGTLITSDQKGIKDFFNNKLSSIGCVGNTIIGMICSMVLCCAIRNSREVIWRPTL
uniref:Uncharacterized protein n=1 Tax=Salarias fasciatus TaxID=181472 RepID=A0A672H2M2_SALFA